MSGEILMSPQVHQARVDRTVPNINLGVPLDQDAETDISQPIVSVVIASYNLDRYIEIALDSVRAQTIQELECVIVDDGSHDRSAEIAEAVSALDPRFRTIRQSNIGASNTRNRGFDAISTKSKYVLFLDSDDFLVPNALEIMVRHLDDNPDVAAVYTESLIIDESSAPIPELQEQYSAKRFVPRGPLLKRLSPSDPETGMETLLAYMTARPTSTLYRTDRFRAAGGWDQSTFPWDDNDLMARMLCTDRVHYLPVLTSHYRIHSYNASKTRLSTAAYQFYRAKLWHMADVPADQALRARRSMIFERYVESVLCMAEAWRLLRRQRGRQRGQGVPHQLTKSVRALAACVGMALCYWSDRLFRRQLPVWRLFPELGFCRPLSP